jgi:CheY-like chemotaxis protein
MRELLEEHGYATIEASNGQQALNLLISQSAERVGLIILDLEMPIMDGHQFLRVLRSYVRLAAVPVLIVSAHAGRLDESEQKRMVGCLRTPYDPNELLAIVEACVPSRLPRDTAGTVEP